MISPFLLIFYHDVVGVPLVIDFGIINEQWRNTRNAHTAQLGMKEK